MGPFKIQIIESIVAVVVLIFTIKGLLVLVARVGKKFDYQRVRIKIIKKAVSLVVYIVFSGIFILIWGIAPQQLTGYLASLFTVIGIAFLAQWSILSNITSTLIVFFNHQVKIGDTISILDKDYQIEGKVSDIGIFFIIIKTTEHEYVSLPSNLFMQKMVKKLNT